MRVQIYIYVHIACPLIKMCTKSFTSRKRKRSDAQNIKFTKKHLGFIPAFKEHVLDNTEQSVVQIMKSVFQREIHVNMQNMHRNQNCLSSVMELYVQDIQSLASIIKPYLFLCKVKQRKCATKTDYLKSLQENLFGTHVDKIDMSVISHVRLVACIFRDVILCYNKLTRKFFKCKVCGFLLDWARRQIHSTTDCDLRFCETQKKSFDTASSNFTEFFFCIPT